MEIPQAKQARVGAPAEKFHKEIQQAKQAGVGAPAEIHKEIQQAKQAGVGAQQREIHMEIPASWGWGPSRENTWKFHKQSKLGLGPAERISHGNSTKPLF